jgi:antitoxin (DNA-binding transcriptional repressor) of toxin-antitoxin stability system
VHVKRYTSSELRSRLAEMLDAAEGGEPVVIERRGTRFVLRAEPVRPRARRWRRPLIEILDPAVADGQWTWGWSSNGLTFNGRSRRR